MTQLLSVQNLCKSFAGKQVVRSVSFEVNQASTLGIVGESGSGKTTLVRSILRAINPDSGTVRYLNSNGWHELSALSDKALLPLLLR